MSLLGSRIVRRTGFYAALCAVVACGGGDSGTDPQTVSVTVRPNTGLIVGVGQSLSFSVVGGASAEWSTSDPSIATIINTGTATGVSSGTTTVTANVNGTIGTATLEVFVPEEIDGYEPGTSYFGRNSYVQYIPGTLPVVISAAHGGDLTPNEVADRTYGVTAADRNTRELTMLLRDALIELTGHAPHTIVSHLHRSKLDPNREIVEAAQEDPYAEQAWREFQDWIVDARAIVDQEFGGGMYFDIHGHGHEVQRVELGYLLSADDLSRSDASISSLSFVAKSSIREIGRLSELPFAQLLRGPTSFGGLLQAEGIRSVPSPSDPSPGGDAYFTGGYNTRQHGSQADGEVVSGIQLEHQFSGIRDTNENRQAYAEQLARVIRAYMLEHFGFFEPG